MKCNRKYNENVNLYPINFPRGYDRKNILNLTTYFPLDETFEL